MHKQPVVILQCSTYHEKDVYSAMKRGMDLLGGIDQFCTPGEKILLKPNFLAPDPPEKGTTTHPAVFNAIARLFINAGAKVSYGDSPATSRPMTVARASGNASVAEKLGIPLADFESGEDVHFAEGRQNKQFHIARGVLDADGLVSVSKMKTHNFTRLTGAIKNQFGCIPGMLKPEFHLKLKDAAQFSRMLVDLNRYIQPRLCVMDGIIAMEGNGPRGGKPYPMNVLLLSRNPAALDAVFSRLVNVDPLTVPPVRWAERYDLGPIQEDQIEIRGEPISDLVRKDFKVPSPDPEGLNTSVLHPFIKNMFSSRPVIDPQVCTHCGVCVRSCPVTPKAVDFTNDNRSDPPAHNYSLCIRCYCCQENCPAHAISVVEPLPKKIFGWGIEKSKRLFNQ